MTDRVKFLTWQEVLDQMVSLLPPQWRANFTGKVLQRLMVAYALCMEALYGLLQKVLRLAIISTSEGQWLRSLVDGMSMDVYGGVAAVAMIKFRRYSDPNNTAIAIPAGAELRVQNGLIFRTDVAAELPAGVLEILVPCTCTTTGSAGNVTGSQIVGLKVAIDGIDEARNPDPAVGGVDPESDASIRARVPKHLAMLHRATVPATEGAISTRVEEYPEVVSFITERRAGAPGYFRGVLADASGGDTFRPSQWTPAAGLSGVYYTLFPASLNPMGLVEAGWPCKRFGVVSRNATGKEIWSPSASATAVSLGAYLWFYDSFNQRLYARANGEDLNALNLTVVAGVIARALADLEDNWAAAGIGVDIIAPFPVRVAVTLTYELEPGYTESVVSGNLESAVNSYIGSLVAGQSFELDNFYSVLGAVPGAAAIVAAAPASTVTVEQSEIIRAGAIAVTRRG